MPRQTFLKRNFAFWMMVQRFKHKGVERNIDVGSTSNKNWRWLNGGKGSCKKGHLMIKIAIFNLQFAIKDAIFIQSSMCFKLKISAY